MSLINFYMVSRELIKKSFSSSLRCSHETSLWNIQTEQKMVLL